MIISQNDLDKLIKEEIEKAIEEGWEKTPDETMPGAEGGGERGPAASGDDIMAATPTSAK